MISIVQNFICTQPSRLEVIERNALKLGKVFSKNDFFVNYNSEINFESVKSHYLDNIPKMNLYNDLTKDWAIVTLALMKEVKTPYTMYICEDMEVNCSVDVMDKCLNEFYENDYDYCFLSIPSPGYKSLNHGYFYLGKHAPHKRVPVDAIFKTEWLIKRLEEFLINGENCTHDIPFRKKHLPNFWEGYYDFHQS